MKMEVQKKRVGLHVLQIILFLFSSSAVQIPLVRAQQSPAPSPDAYLASSTSPCLQALKESQYTLFAALVQEGRLGPGVLDALYNYGNQVTVFVPSNEALQTGLTDSGLTFLQSSNSILDLQNILLSHFVGQELVLDDFVNTTLLITLSGDPVMIQRSGSTVTADNQTVSSQTILTATDCIFHELEGVIVPSTISSAALQAGIIPTTMVQLLNATHSTPTNATLTVTNQTTTGQVRTVDVDTRTPAASSAESSLRPQSVVGTILLLALTSLVLV